MLMKDVLTSLAAKLRARDNSCVAVAINLLQLVGGLQPTSHPAKHPPIPPRAFKMQGVPAFDPDALATDVERLLGYGDDPKIGDDYLTDLFGVMEKLPRLIASGV
jgi:hypothetical protein